MKNPLFLSLLALFSWGLWAFLPRYVSKYMDARGLMLYQALGGLLAAFMVLAISPGKVGSNPLGAGLGLLTGVCAVFGMYFYSLALEKGNAIVVVSISSLYPLVAILLFCLVFKDTINIRQGVGLGFALMAIYLMAQ